MNSKIPSGRLTAAVRSGVLASLLEAYFRYRPDRAALLPRRRVTLTVSGSGAKRLLEFGPAGVREIRGRAGFPSVALWFPGEYGLGDRLAGAGAAVVPLPLGPGAFVAVRAFTRASAEVSAFMSAEPADGETGDKARMLLTAALRGVAEIAGKDPWLAGKAAHLPTGDILVAVGPPENQAFSARIRRRPECTPVGARNAGHAIITEFIPEWNDAKDARPRAELRFRDLETASAVLSGRLNAMEALGSGLIRVSGLISYIQGIFPLLDRFGQVMAGLPRKDRA